MHASALVSDPIDPALRRAVRPLQEAIADDPTNPASLRNLYDLYQRAYQDDRACCVAEALMVLHKASPGQTLWRGQHRPRSLPAARQSLSPELLRHHVVHPDQDPYLSAMLTLIAPALAAWRARETPAQLEPSARVDAAVHPSDAARMVKYAQRVLGVDLPDLYLQPGSQGDLTLLNLERNGVLHPTLVLFDGLLDRRKEPELGFVVARAMADLYQPHFAFVAVDRSPAALRLVLGACIHALGFPFEGDAAALDVIAHEIMGRISRSTRRRLSEVVTRAMQRGVELDCERWADAAELTSCRVGLLLGGDLCSAGRALEHDPSPLCAPARHSHEDLRDELIRYGVSDDYFAVRSALGIDVTV